MCVCVFLNLSKSDGFSNTWRKNTPQIDLWRTFGIFKCNIIIISQCTRQIMNKNAAINQVILAKQWFTSHKFFSLLSFLLSLRTLHVSYVNTDVIVFLWKKIWETKTDFLRRSTCMIWESFLDLKVNRNTSHSFQCYHPGTFIPLGMENLQILFILRRVLKLDMLKGSFRYTFSFSYFCYHYVRYM